VPLAITRPRFQAAWLLALPLWLVPGSGNGGAWDTGLALVVLFTILVVCERSPSRIVTTDILREDALAT